MSRRARVSPSLSDVLASLAAQGVVLPEGPPGLGFYGDSESLSDQLVALICDRKKRATSSLLWAYESEGEALPKLGDVAIVLDFAGRPVAILALTTVNVLPFSSVSATFAAAEGEMDGSLDSWRREHWRCFSNECCRIGRSPSETTLVVCCEFELLQVLRRGTA